MAEAISLNTRDSNFDFGDTEDYDDDTANELYNDDTPINFLPQEEFSKIDHNVYNCPCTYCQGTHPETLTTISQRSQR
jgi:hypothetical protein